MSYSASVVRNGKIYVFFNGIDEATDLPILQILSKAPNDISYSKTTMRISAGDEGMVPASEGPIEACIVDNPTKGIRLYVVRKNKVTEYGLDTKPNEKEAWVQQQFTSDIDLAPGSFFTALGAGELGGVTGTSGQPAKLRIYYTSSKKPKLVSEATYSDKWETGLVRL